MKSDKPNMENGMAIVELYVANSMGEYYWREVTVTSFYPCKSGFAYCCDNRYHWVPETSYRNFRQYGFPN